MRHLVAIGRRIKGETQVEIARAGAVVKLSPARPLRGLAYLRSRAELRPPRSSAWRRAEPEVQHLIDEFRPVRELDDHVLDAEAATYEQRRWGEALSFVVWLMVRGYHGGWE